MSGALVGCSSSAGTCRIGRMAFEVSRFPYRPVAAVSHPRMREMRVGLRRDSRHTTRPLTPLLRPLPDLGIGVVDADLGVLVPFHFDLELERLPDELGRTLVRVLDRLRVFLAIDDVRAAVVIDDLAGPVGFSDGPVLAGKELEAATGRRRFADVVRGPGQDGWKCSWRCPPGEGSESDHERAT